MSAGGVGTASGAGAFVRVASDGQIFGMAGAEYFQDGVFYDGNFNVVTPTADVELVKLKSSRTGAVRLVTLAALAALL